MIIIVVVISESAQVSSAAGSPTTYVSAGLMKKAVVGSMLKTAVKQELATSIVKSNV